MSKILFFDMLDIIVNHMRKMTDYRLFLLTNESIL